MNSDQVLKKALSKTGFVFQRMEQYVKMEGGKVVPVEPEIVKAKKRVRVIMEQGILQAYKSAPPTRRAEALYRLYNALDGMKISISESFELSRGLLSPEETAKGKASLETAVRISQVGISDAKAKCVSLFLELPKAERTRSIAQVGPYSPFAIANAFFGEMGSAISQFQVRINSIIPKGSSINKVEFSDYKKKIIGDHERRFRAMYLTVPGRERELFLRGILAYGKGLVKGSKTVSDLVRPVPSAPREQLIFLGLTDHIVSGLWTDVGDFLEKKARTELKKIHSPKSSKQK